MKFLAEKRPNQLFKSIKCYGFSQGWKSLCNAVVYVIKKLLNAGNLRSYIVTHRPPQEFKGEQLRDTPKNGCEEKATSQPRVKVWPEHFFFSETFS